MKDNAIDPNLAEAHAQRGIYMTLKYAWLSLKNAAYQKNI